MWFIPEYSILAPAARAILGRKMELYAGLVENLDYHIGRLIDHLKEIGEYENTVFIVFGDNGAEGNDLGAMIGGTPGTRDNLFWHQNGLKHDPNAWGDPDSYVGYGPGWAQVSMTPFSQYKGWVAEGGIRNALVVSGPIDKLPKGSINNGLMFIADIMPTFLEVSRVPSILKKIMEGATQNYRKSWSGVLNGQSFSPHRERLYSMGNIRQSCSKPGRLETALGDKTLGQV